MDYRPRRLFAVLALCCTCSTSHAESRDPPLRFGITAVILQDQNEFLAQWETHLESRLGRDVEFVQRGSYAEISELLSRDAIDIAWVCGAPYVRHRDRWRLVAVPLADGKPSYQSYLIVRTSDTCRGSGPATRSDASPASSGQCFRICERSARSSGIW